MGPVQASSVDDWEWRPTQEGRKLFEEWKGFCVQYLVTSKEGVNIRLLPAYLEESVGESIPLQKMGFPSISHFLYEMKNSIEVRTLDRFKIFVFIRDYAIPQNMKHVRDMVMGQAKDKSCKGRRGDIKKPTKNQSTPANVDILLQTAIRRPMNSQGPKIFSRPSAVPARRPLNSLGPKISSRPSVVPARRPLNSQDPQISCRPSVAPAPTPPLLEELEWEKEDFCRSSGSILPTTSINFHTGNITPSKTSGGMSTRPRFFLGLDEDAFEDM